MARFWENSHDAYIAALRSVDFNAQVKARRAAVLGFAEPGVVFKYPFLTRAPRLFEIEYLIVLQDDKDWAIARFDNRESITDKNPPDGLDRPNRKADFPKIISPEIAPKRVHNRTEIEKSLNQLLARQGIRGAVARPSAIYPGAAVECE